MVGARRKCSAYDSGLDPAPHAEQSPLRPPAHGGWIGQTRRIFAVRRGLLGRFAGGDPLTGLLPAVQAVVPGRRQPIGQDREGLPARPADSASHPDAFVLVIVAWRESPSVADDRVVAANGTSPRQESPAESPRLDVVFRLWQCDKKNHGWREGPPLTVPAKVSICWPGLHPPGKVSLERKKNTAFRARREPLPRHWPVILRFTSTWTAQPNSEVAH